MTNTNLKPFMLGVLSGSTFVILVLLLISMVPSMMGLTLIANGTVSNTATTLIATSVDSDNVNNIHNYDNESFNSFNHNYNHSHTGDIGVNSSNGVNNAVDTINGLASEKCENNSFTPSNNAVDMSSKESNDSNDKFTNSH